MSREKHFRFSSAEGTVVIHGVCWIPDGEIKAVLQIVHGMAEHVERYREMGYYFADRGILVTGHDHLGHGSTAEKDEDFGFFAEEKGNLVLVEDIHRCYKMTKKKYPDMPYILLGHSMGSFLVRQYLCVYGEELDGAIICGTGYQPMPTLLFGMTVCKAMAKIYGWHHRSKLLDQLSVGNGNERFEPIRTSADWLSRNEENVDRYLADPKCGFCFTVNGFYNMYLGMSKIIQKDYLQHMPHKLPILFISGEEDPVGNFGKGVLKVEKMFREAGMEKVECILYPEDRHEILNETDREQVYEDVLKWMNL